MSGPWTNLSADERVAWHWGRWRRALPLLAALVAALALAAPMLAPSPLVPLWPLLFVIAWSLYAPELMPAWAALIVGLATDLALAVPPGVNATLMPVLALLVRAGGPQLGARDFWIDWLLTGPVIAIYQLLAVGLAGLIGAGRDPMLVIGQVLLGWALFPAVARLVAWGQRRIGATG